MRIGWMILPPLCVAIAAAAEDAEKLPDPFLDGVNVGDTSLVVKAALEENGWTTSEEWLNIERDPTLKLLGESGNRKLIYNYDQYGRLSFLTYLEQWPSLGGCEKAYEVWYDFLKMSYDEPAEETEHNAYWSVAGFEVKLYDSTFISGESTMPTMMINIYILRIF